MFPVPVSVNDCRGSAAVAMGFGPLDCVHESVFYHKSPTNKKVAQAKSYCASAGGTLVMPKNQQQWDALGQAGMRCNYFFSIYTVKIIIERLPPLM